ncbi:uncharacterized protein LOC108675798, partial [Hyalella azteca]|uniref:Uncharacterized protein LOC108675798 n=1 Tax=Hyalella azteca TaxID=294128 RepID=A0A8B7NZX0_HYAAZ
MESLQEGLADVESVLSASMLHCSTVHQQHILNLLIHRSLGTDALAMRYRGFSLLPKLSDVSSNQRQASNPLHSSQENQLQASRNFVENLTELSLNCPDSVPSQPEKFTNGNVSRNCEENLELSSLRRSCDQPDISRSSQENGLDKSGESLHTSEDNLQHLLMSGCPPNPSRLESMDLFGELSTDNNPSVFPMQQEFRRKLCLGSYNAGGIPLNDLGEELESTPSDIPVNHVDDKNHTRYLGMCVKKLLSQDEFLKNDLKSARQNSARTKKNPAACGGFDTTREALTVAAEEATVMNSPINYQILIYLLFHASCHGNRTVMVWLSATGALVRVLRGHMRSVWCATFHPRHSHLLATACLGDLVLVWHE